MKEGGVLDKMALVYGQMNEHARLATVCWPDRHAFAIAAYWVSHPGSRFLYLRLHVTALQKHRRMPLLEFP